MVRVDQIQQVFNNAAGFVAKQPEAFAVAALAIATAFALAVEKHLRRKRLVAKVTEIVNAPRETFTSKPYDPKLPLPDADDHDYIRQLGLPDFRAQDGMRLYGDGVAQNELRTALIGLRFYSQYALDGGYQSYISPSGEYEEVANGYLALGRMHNSQAYFKLAYSALLASYVIASSISEPSTIALERRLSRELETLEQEMAARAET